MTRGNGNTAKHLCRMDFYRYRDPRTWKQGLMNINNMIIVPQYKYDMFLYVFLLHYQVEVGHSP